MTSAQDYTRPSTRLSRKEMLKLSLLGGAALLLPLQQRAARTGARINRLPESRLPEPFGLPFVVPRVARPVHRTATTDYYEMTMTNAPMEILPGLRTEVWGYDGITPGPTIVARRGRRTVVRHVNRITNPDHVHTSVHLHGNASPPQYDGYASDVTKRGEYKNYVYPNIQPARTLWYHDHGVHHTAHNAYMGLAAFYITHDDLEESLTDPEDATHKERGTAIPGGNYDVPLVIRDALFGEDGSLIFDSDERGSVFGDVVLANGVPWPRMKVERRKYRFRVLNASVSRGFKLALSTHDPLWVIGTDGGLMPTPQRTESMRVGLAERYEVVIDFSGYAPGTKVDLKNLRLPNNPDYPSTRNVMRFEVVGSPVDGTPLPAELDPENAVMGLTERDASPETRRKPVRLELVRQHGHWTINGRTWQDVIDSGFREVVANPRRDEVQLWELENKSGGWNHPLHIHLIDFKVLSRTGGSDPVVHPYEKGPKDTVYLGENEKVRVVMRFEHQEGRYMVHCHNLVHEDHDMMVQFNVGRSYPNGGDPNDPIHADPAGPYTATTPPVWHEVP